MTESTKAEGRRAAPMPKAKDYVAQRIGIAMPVGYFMTPAFTYGGRSLGRTYPATLPCKCTGGIATVIDVKRIGRVGGTPRWYGSVACAQCGHKIFDRRVSDIAGDLRKWEENAKNR